MPEDPFATPAVDPFGGATTTEAPPEADPFTPVEEAAPFTPPEVSPEPSTADVPADIPVVNAEGERVAAEPEVAPEPEPPAVEPVEPPAPAEVAQAAVEAVEVAAAVPAVPATPPAPAPAPPAATTASTTTDAVPPAATRPPGPRGGKGELRHYKLLYLSGPGTWTQCDLAKVPKDIGVVVCLVAPDKELTDLAEKKAKLANSTGETAARLTGEIDSLEKLHKELWFEARNNEHANRLGYAIMGAPKAGVYIFPVPRGAWKPKHVKPAPPAPEKVRVQIY